MDIMFQSCGKFTFWKQLKVDHAQYRKDSKDDWHPITNLHVEAIFLGRLKLPYKAVPLLIAMLWWAAAGFVLQGAEPGKPDRRSNQVLIRADAAGTTWDHLVDGR